MGWRKRNGSSQIFQLSVFTHMPCFCHPLFRPEGRKHEQEHSRGRRKTSLTTSIFRKPESTSVLSSSQPMPPAPTHRTFVAATRAASSAELQVPEPPMPPSSAERQICWEWEEGGRGGGAIVERLFCFSIERGCDRWVEEVKSVEGEQRTKKKRGTTDQTKQKTFFFIFSLPFCFSLLPSSLCL